MCTPGLSHPLNDAILPLSNHSNLDLTKYHALPHKQVREWEIYVLQRLEYNMTMVTPMHCITYFNGRGVVFKGTAF